MRALGLIFEPLGVICGALGFIFGALGLIFEALVSLRGLGAHFGGPKIDLLDGWRDFWVHLPPFGSNFGDFFGERSMQKSASFSDVEKVALGTEKVAILSLGDPENDEHN